MAIASSVQSNIIDCRCSATYPGGLELECQHLSPYARLKNATGPVMTVVKRPSAASNTIIDEPLLRWWRLGGLATRKSKALALFHPRPRPYFEVNDPGAKSEERPMPPITKAKGTKSCHRGHNIANLRRALWNDTLCLNLTLFRP